MTARLTHETWIIALLVIVIIAIILVAITAFRAVHVYVWNDGSLKDFKKKSIKLHITMIVIYAMIAFIAMAVVAALSGVQTITIGG